MGGGGSSPRRLECTRSATSGRRAPRSRAVAEDLEIARPLSCGSRDDVHPLELDATPNVTFGRALRRARAQSGIERWQRDRVAANGRDDGPGAPPLDEERPARRRHWPLASTAVPIEPLRLENVAAKASVEGVAVALVKNTVPFLE